MFFIEDTKSLVDLSLELRKNTFITVDTEFIGEHTYYPKLCLIQVASNTAEAVIDPLAKGIDLSPFFDILADSSITKVFHSARQDVDIFYHLMGKMPQNLFDTQVAAMVCGLGDMVSYQTLCEILLGIELDKSERFTDWSLRPLSQKQLSYALCDVTYLKDAYIKMCDTLSKEGRLAWISEEMQSISDSAIYEKRPEDAWQKIKNHSKDKRFLAVLQQLAKWREEEAIALNKPRRQVLKDENLVEIATRQPQTIAELKSLRGLPIKVANGRYGEQLLGAVKQGLTIPTGQRPSPIKRHKYPQGMQSLQDVMTLLLTLKSAEYKVSPHLIISPDEMNNLLLEQNPKIRALEQGWRYDVFGADALLLKAGKLKICYNPITQKIELEKTS